MGEFMNENEMKKTTIVDVINSLLPVIIQIAIFVLIVVIVPKLFVFFLPLILGYIIALISNKFVASLEEKFHIPRKRTSLLIVILVTLILLGIIALIVYLIYSQASKFVADIKSIVDDLNYHINAVEVFINAFLRLLPFDFGKGINLPTLTGNNIMNLLNNFSKPIANYFLMFAKNIPLFIANTIFMILSAYILIIENEKVRAFAKKMVSNSIYEYYVFLKKEILFITNGWLKAQIITLLLVFVILTIGFLIIKVKYAVLLALIIAVIDALPIFGSGLFLWPWMIIDLVNGKFLELFILIIMYVAIQFVRNIVQNKIMSAELGLNPFLALLFLFLGYKLFGIIGFIFAIPLGILLISLYNFGTFNNFINSFKKFFSTLKVYLQQK